MLPLYAAPIQTRISILIGVTLMHTFLNKQTKGVQYGDAKILQIDRQDRADVNGGG